MSFDSVRNVTHIAGRWLAALTKHSLWPRRRIRHLQLCETIPLGEHRFVAVIRYEQQRFLVGGTGNAIALLAQLPGNAGQTGRSRGATRKCARASASC